jgi:hypothetical protein
MLGDAPAAAAAHPIQAFPGAPAGRLFSNDPTGGNVADRVRTTRGVSLAKGPVGFIGLVALIYGVLGLVFGNSSFTAHPVNGTVTGTTFLGIMGNGWTYALMAVGGLLLLLAAPMHWGAKTMAIVVGIAWGAACVIALIQGDSALGIFAENGWTKVAFGAGALALFISAMLPRVGRRRTEDDAYIAERDRDRTAGGRFSRRREPAAAPRETATTTHDRA